MKLVSCQNYNLYLYQNKITSLPHSIGDLDQLIYLNLANNEIEFLPNSIYSLSNLQFLSLHDNKLNSINNAVRNLTQLKELYLHNNELLSLPSGIDSLTNLQYLYLQNNQLTSLPSTISNLQNLYYIQLQHNQLTDLPMNFPNCPYNYYYGYLNLSYNNFSKVPQTLYQDSNNRWYSIDFSHNQFEALYSNLLASYTPASLFISPYFLLVLTYFACHIHNKMTLKIKQPKAIFSGYVLFYISQ